MKIATKIRLMSMKKGIQGDVARIVLENTDSESNLDIMRLLKDISNNGCAYSNIVGIRYNDEIRSFYDRNKMDIELLVFLYETHKDGRKVEIVGSKESSYTFFTFNEIVNEIIGNINKR